MVESKEDNLKITEEKRERIEREVRKLREYEKLGFVGE